MPDDYKIPHQQPFLFVDGITSIEAGKISCKKVICDDDIYLIYGEKFVSEVTLLECLLQSAAILLCRGSGDGGEESITESQSTKYFVGSPRINVWKVPSLGDSLDLKVEMTLRIGRKVRFRGQIWCSGNLLVEGIFVVADESYDGD